MNTLEMKGVDATCQVGVFYKTLDGLVTLENFATDPSWQQGVIFRNYVHEGVKCRRTYMYKGRKLGGIKIYEEI